MRAACLIGVLTVLVGCRSSVDQPVLMNSCVVQLEYTSKEPPVVVSERTGFQPSAQPMERVRGDVWRTQLQVPTDRRSLYWIDVDGDRFPDPKNPLTQPHEGSLVSVIYPTSCDQPTLEFVSKEGSPSQPRITLVLRRGADAASLDGETVRANLGGHGIPAIVDGDHIYLQVSGVENGRYQLAVEAKDEAGRVASISSPIWIEDEMFRWENATIYQIMVDRFAGERDLSVAERSRPPGYRVGGTIRGILRKLRTGYFEEMGVNALWLSPLYANPGGRWVGVEGGPARYESYHGYWPIHPRQLEPLLGDEDDLDALIEAAHDRGIRVIVDVVPNHVHEEHVYLETHPEWFSDEPCICGTAQCPWWSHIQSCWFTPYMPDVNWEAPGALEQTVADMTWWIERFKVDGLRVDAVPMMPRFVVRHLQHQVRSQFEQFGTRHYLVGETFTGPGGYDPIRYPLGSYGLDGQFDFPLMWSLREALAWESVPLSRLVSSWHQSEDAWAGSASVMATMVGNHDVTRFISEAHSYGLPYADPWAHPASDVVSPSAHRRLRLALALVLSLPGAPVIYYGDEIGMPGARDPDNRRPMRFAGDLRPVERETLSWTQRLGSLRRCVAALRSERVEFSDFGAEHLSVWRQSRTNSWAVLDVQRAAAAPRAIRLNHRWSGNLVDALTGDRYEVEDGRTAELDLPAYSARLLLKEGDSCLSGQ